MSRMLQAVEILLLLALCAAPLQARTDADMDKLLNEGKYYIMRESPQIDSAIICFKRVADCYSPEISLEQKRKCATAANNLGYIYYQHLTDYRTAYNWLVKAQDICLETGSVLTSVNVYLNMGNIFSVFAEHSPGTDFGRLSENMYLKAFETARENRLWYPMLSLFANLTSLGTDLSFLERFPQIIDEFGECDIPSSTPNFRYCTLRYKALKSIQEKDYAKATVYLKTHIDTIDADITVPAYRCQALSLTSTIYMTRQMPDSALAYARKLLDYARASRVDEMKSTAYKLLEKGYRLKNDSAAANLAHIHFLIEQDSLLNHHGLATVENLRFINELKNEKKKSSLLMAEAERRQKVREIIIFFALLLLGVAVPLLLIIINRHRMLKATYQSLYDNYRQNLLREEETGGQRKSSFTVPGNALSGKNKILSVMNDCDEIYSPDFSLDRLAELTEIKPRVLSAIINETFKTTFRDLLNSYRVREACRRLSDTEKYGNLTIEAISQSVGYRSRTSLISAFKKETGLTPSQYQKLARKS